jgi:2-polyprenyl-6-methoxyphenol hydroxylase-like FAD-dependent oxidoreductase
VHLSDGETLEAELLVGADGPRSTVRRLLRGAKPLLPWPVCRRAGRALDA